MPEANDMNAALLSNPVGAPLIDVDEPAPAKPAPAAEEQKTDTPAATEENAESQEQQAQQQATDTPEQQEARKQSRRQRKLQIEREARIRAETRAEMAERALAESQAKTAASPQNDEPQRDQFDDYESYLRAVAKYDAKQEAEQTLRSAREAHQQREAQSRTQAAERQMAEDWIKREKEFTAKVPTFEEDVTPFLDGELQQFSKEARRAIVEMGPEILHRLATDDDLVDDILKMSPLRQVAALGRIEASKQDASKQEAAKAEPETEQATQAQQAPRQRAPEPPPPAKHVRQGSSAPAALSDDMDTYIKQRAQQGARWAR